MTRQRILLTSVFCTVGAATLLAGCTAQRGESTQRPAELVVWDDPDSAGSGTTIRDANNDSTRFVVIGTNGAVQFSPGETVCNDCEADVDNATIDVQGNMIDIRFGVGVTGDTNRRLFLVDRESGNFVQLVGGGSAPVEFQVTDTAFEDPDDPSDDQAVAAGTSENPANAGDDGGGGTGNSGLCGIFGAPALILMALAPALMWRRRKL
jgi:hypothetical protein